MMSAGAGVLYTLFEGHEENDGPTFWVLLRQFSEPEENPEVQMKGIPGSKEYAAFRGSDTAEAPLAAGAGSWLHFGSCSD